MRSERSILNDWQQYALAQSVGSCGRAIEGIVTLYLAYHLTSSIAAVAGLAAIHSIAMLLVLLGGTPAGPARRFSQKTLVLAATAAHGLVMAVPVVLAFADAITLPLLYLVHFLHGLIGGYAMPWHNTYRQALTPPDTDRMAIAFIQSGGKIGALIGFVLGGLLVDSVGIPVAYTSGFLFIVPTFLSLAAIREAGADQGGDQEPPAGHARNRLVRDAIIMLEHPDLRVILIVFFAVLALTSPLESFLPKMAHGFGSGVLVLALLKSAMALGPAFSVLWIRVRHDVLKFQIALLCGILAAALIIVQLATSHDRLIGAILSLTMFSFCYSLLYASLLAKMDLHAATMGRARVSRIFTLIQILTAFVALAWSALADVVGMRAVILLLAGGLLLLGSAHGNWIRKTMR